MLISYKLAIVRLVGSYLIFAGFGEGEVSDVDVRLFTWECLKVKWNTKLR